MTLTFWIRVAAGAALVCSSAQAADGAALYKAQCVACHGPAAAGNIALQAPPLAGADAAYLVRQLNGFRAGYRGGDAATPTAQAMRGIALGLKGDEDIAAVARHLARLAVPASKAETSPAAQLNLGKSLHGVCVACHGTWGEGNRELNAPRLSHLPSWYIAAQLASFRAGTRGAADGDALGRQMRQVALESLAGDDEAGAVARYISTLAKPAR
ncbi:c-type cytochrome [Rubrivivax sp. JA1024]|nr:c-type cytochrome [Rubrivivax sp. JA1024]